MKMFSASESAHTMIERARAIPARTSTASSEASPSMKRTPTPSARRSAGGAGVDHHVLGARRVQVAGDLVPHAAEAADDVVVGERVDHLLHAPCCEQIAEVPGHEELGDHGEGVEERTDPQHDQRDVNDLPGRAVWLGKAADRGDRVERPLERVPGADVSR